MKISALVALAAVSALGLACSSSTPSTTGPATQQDPGVTGGGDPSAAGAPDSNPDGVPYPVANVGINPRSGNTPGNTMQNYKFLGFKDGKISNGLTPMSLADFFDPQAKQYRLIRIQASGSWCVHCEKETETVATLASDLASRKVAWIISLAEGPTPGTPSTTGDLTAWINKYEAPYTHFLDPGNRNFGPFYNAAALPWNATLDARTMEIIDSQVGGLEDSKTLLADIDAELAKLSP